MAGEELELESGEVETVPLPKSMSHRPKTELGDEIVGHVGKASDGRVIYGILGTKYAHLAGRFYAIAGQNVWGGGAVTMPYYTDRPKCPFLTDADIERFYPQLVKEKA